MAGADGFERIAFIECGHAKYPPTLLWDCDAARLRTLLDDDENTLWRMPDVHVRERVARLIDDGRLVLFELKPRLQPPQLAAQAAVVARPLAVTPSMLRGSRAAEAPAPLTSMLHWIEIELVGEDDAPIPHQPYEIRLPDGLLVQGALDERGLARIDRLPVGGECRVRFPQLDRDAWQPAEARA